MRQMISGLVAAAAVMFTGAAVAADCGYTACAPIAPVAPVYSGCNTGCGGSWGYGPGYGGWGFEYLAEPTTQYYYVNQGPTYTGPGAFAPYPTYREDAVVVPGNYGYGYRGVIAAPGAYRPYYRPYRYGYGPRYGYLPRTHYGYGARYGHRAPYYGGHRAVRRYY
jgi:hypothetical protein